MNIRATALSVCLATITGHGHPSAASEKKHEGALFHVEMLLQGVKQLRCDYIVKRHEIAGAISSIREIADAEENPKLAKEIRNGLRQEQWRLAYTGLLVKLKSAHLMKRFSDGIKSLEGKMGPSKLAGLKKKAKIIERELSEDWDQVKGEDKLCTGLHSSVEDRGSENRGERRAGLGDFFGATTRLGLTMLHATKSLLSTLWGGMSYPFRDTTDPSQL